ncbi:MAG: (2Fe-2S) ferredoxin domain-containing protein [Armatimonadetes bacterium]|nr:(2Fe-2S) ferredoxin domain-containing protein [Armatimonadota bacterium]
MSETKALTSLEALRRLKEEAHREIHVRESTGTKIIVGMGTCGIAAGAREVMRAVLDELARQEIEVQVTTVGCIGMCAQEPLLDIVQAGGSRVTYGKVNPEMVPRIIKDHLVEGRPVEEWVIGRIIDM